MDVRADGLKKPWLHRIEHAESSVADAEERLHEPQQRVGDLGWSVWAGLGKKLGLAKVKSCARREIVVEPREDHRHLEYRFSIECISLLEVGTRAYNIIQGRRCKRNLSVRREDAKLRLCNTDSNIISAESQGEGEVKSWRQEMAALLSSS